MSNIVLLLNGEPCSGKTETAKTLCPPARMQVEEDRLRWDHLSFAAPLRDLYTIRTETSGDNSEERQLWLIAETLNEFRPALQLPYSDYVELIYDLQSLPVDEDKRLFMLQAADLIHAHLNQPFARRVRNECRSLFKQTDADVDHVILVSDLRTNQEYNIMKSLQHEGIKVLFLHYYCSEPVLQERQEKRLESKHYTDQHKQFEIHHSPFGFSDFDRVIDTTNLDLTEQALATRSWVYEVLNKLGSYA